jgi:hypothetical protein
MLRCAEFSEHVNEFGFFETRKIMPKCKKKYLPTLITSNITVAKHYV